MTQSTTTRSHLKIAAFLLLAVATGGISAHDADAGKRPSKYAVVDLVNETKFRIHYELMWGTDRRTLKDASVPPGRTMMHGWMLRRAGEEKAPALRVRVDGDSDWYVLRPGFTASKEGSGAREYAFKAKKGKDGVYSFVLHAKLSTR